MSSDEEDDSKRLARMNIAKKSARFDNAPVAVQKRAKVEPVPKVDARMRRVQSGSDARRERAMGLMVEEPDEDSEAARQRKMEAQQRVRQEQAKAVQARRQAEEDARKGKLVIDDGTKTSRDFKASSRRVDNRSLAEVAQAGAFVPPAAAAAAAAAAPANAAPVAFDYTPYFPTEPLAAFQNKTYPVNKFDLEAVKKAMDASVLGSTTQDGFGVLAPWSGQVDFTPGQTLTKEQQRSQEWVNPDTWKERMILLLTRQDAAQHMVYEQTLDYSFAEKTIGLKKLPSARGAHNEIFTIEQRPPPFDQRTTDQQYFYPPQFDKIFESGAAFVMRITKLNSVMSFDSRDKADKEIYYALDASARGLGPRVFGATVFTVPCVTGMVDENGKQVASEFSYRWGTIIVMEKLKMDMSKYQPALGTKFPKSRWAEGKTLQYTLGDGPKIQKRIEALAHACVDLCAKMAAPPYNAINFDINQRNILVADDMVDGDDGVPSTVTLKFIDFDGMYYKVGSEVASFEGAMLANLLSLAVHVRAQTDLWYGGHFCAAVRNTLLELAAAVATKNDARDGWLLTASRNRNGPCKDPVGLGTDTQTIGNTWRYVVDHYFFHPPDRQQLIRDLETLAPNVNSSKDRAAFIDKYTLPSDSDARRRYTDLMDTLKQSNPQPGYPIERYHPRFRDPILNTVNFLTRPRFIRYPAGLWASGWDAVSQMRELLRFAVFYDQGTIKKPDRPSLQDAAQERLVSFKVTA